jgi:UV DNA damage endonuclease
VHEATGIGLIFDHHHHLLNPGPLPVGEACRSALATWPAGETPKVHFSSPRLEARTLERGGRAVAAPPLLSQHADYVHGSPGSCARCAGSRST